MLTAFHLIVNNLIIFLTEEFHLQVMAIIFNLDINFAVGEC